MLDAYARDATYEALLARLKEGADNFVTVSEAAHLYAKLSWYLSERDRDAEAWQVGRIVLDSDAANAFVPVFHALSCVYLGRWAEAHRNITQALNDPDLWQEAHVQTTAIHALILGALGKSLRCQQAFLRNENALKEIEARVMSVDEPDSKAERESFCALVQARMGDASHALDRHAASLKARPDDRLVIKRHAEITAMAGRPRPPI